MKTDEYKKFADLVFDDFRRMAKDDSLSRYEKIGFPDSYRKGKESFIFEDISAKLPLLNAKAKMVMDIGPGCSELPSMIIDLCQTQNHQLLLIDSEEMLSHLSNKSFITKIVGYFPYCEGLLEKYQDKIDVIITYSVLHYIFVESNIWDFIDVSLSLLSHGGEMLIGDIPNISKRKRFFSSPNGIKFHQNFMKSSEIPEVTFNTIERHKIDDSVISAIINRVRNQGCDAYLLPQRDDLPMANRREDILIRKP